MYVRDIIKLSFLNVFRSKTRNLLTILAITIGVSSVLLVYSIGESGENIVNQELNKLGLNGISVFSNQSPNAVPLYAEDAENLENRFTCIERALPIVLETGSLKFNKVSSEAVLFGVGRDAEEVYNVTLLYGRTPNQTDVKAGKKVAVIDDELAIKAYKRENVVGKSITIKIGGKSEEFDIIGVIRSQKEGINYLLGNSLPNFVYLPYSTLNDLRSKKEISQIAISCSQEYDVEGSTFSNFLSREKSAPGAYSSKNISSKINEIKSLSGLISNVMSAVASIALLVAGIGIMNAMLSSTTERQKEIGILMAIGATKRNILTCFLTEALIIVFIGKSLGTLISFMFLKSISQVANFEIMFGLKTFLTAEIIALICGTIFSIIPAMKASKLNPIIALGR